MRFRAFLSYSHADAAWARWLLRRLETYRVPSRLVGTTGTHGVIGPRLGVFCRDREELPSSGDLGATIRGALAESAALIVICSPSAAHSRWVNAEIEAFQANGGGDRILCVVVAGVPGSADPAEECFPPALLRPGVDGAPSEPLAADARREGDGRERAFLKLVAGLLGIGYDALARREAQRRNRRLTLVAAAAIAGMTIALGLAATAYVARNDAQRRQAQAEDILGFMLGDLREKLTTVGRLDLMRAVDAKATHYFATLDPRDLSDRALEEQARSLTGIGQVRLDEGNHDAAMVAFREAHARSTTLREREPGNGQRLFDLAQAEYWIGAVALQQGRHDDTAVWFRKYRDSAARLATMDRDNFDWQKELAYGHHNLAVLDERLGRYAEAERAMHEERALYRDWLRQRPRDLELRFEDANNASWLGSLSARQGKLAAATGFFEQEFEAMHRNAGDDPLNARWKMEEVDALLLLTEALVQRGLVDEARARIATAMPLATGLAARDASNFDWQVALGISHWWRAQLATSALQAGLDAARAASILSAAHTTEPQDSRVLRWLARARLLQARLALAQDGAMTAREHVRAAQALLDPAWNSGPTEPLRLTLAEALLLGGETAQRLADAKAATTAWSRAHDLLLADAHEGLPFERLDPLVRTLHHLGRVEQAQPHRQRLDNAGYIPLRPFQDSNASASDATHRSLPRTDGPLARAPAAKAIPPAGELPCPIHRTSISICASAVPAIRAGIT